MSGEVSGFLFSERNTLEDLPLRHSVILTLISPVLSDDRALSSVTRQLWRRIKHEKDNIN